VDKDPCPVCGKARAEYSNASLEKLNEELWKLAEHAK
jgi:hypothetical protein